MGSVGNNNYINAVNNLLNPSKNATFSDSKVSPLKLDQSKLMEVNFGDWKKEENFVSVQEVPIENLVTTQPYVQSGKLSRFGGAIDTSDVPVLKIGDKFYVADGNHRIVSNVLSGKKKVKVRVYQRNNANNNT